jgi:hypothetical protein
MYRAWHLSRLALRAGQRPSGAQDWSTLCAPKQFCLEMFSDLPHAAAYFPFQDVALSACLRPQTRLSSSSAHSLPMMVTPVHNKRSCEYLFRQSRVLSALTCLTFETSSSHRKGWLGTVRARGLTSSTKTCAMTLLTRYGYHKIT